MEDKSCRNCDHRDQIDENINYCPKEARYLTEMELDGCSCFYWKKRRTDNLILDDFKEKRNENIKT